jgi:hypothetical protein
MNAIEIILSIAGFLIIALSGALWWFIRRQIALSDKDREALLRGHVDTVILKKEIQAIHHRFDALMELLREKLKII